MREAAVFQTEAEFREWFERNLTRFGFARVILSQEPCPDYVLERLDGTIVRAEAELFAINFRYHRHDPAKVDLIIACYAKEPELDGIPVIAANELWAEEEEVLEPLSPEGELSDVGAIILSMALATGGIDISAMASNSTVERLAGNHSLFFRIPPEAKMPRGKMADNLFTVVTEDARQFMKKYHHVLIGSGLSMEACEALQSLRRRGLIRYRPIEIAAALYDGVLVNHPGWVPTELQATDDARRLHRSALRNRFPIL